MNMLMIKNTCASPLPPFVSMSDLSLTLVTSHLEFEAETLLLMSFERALSTNRHEHRGVTCASIERQASRSCFAVSCNDFEFECLWGRTSVHVNGTLHAGLKRVRMALSISCLVSLLVTAIKGSTNLTHHLSISLDNWIRDRYLYSLFFIIYYLRR